MEEDKVQKPLSFRFVMWIWSRLMLLGVLMGIGFIVGLIAGGFLDVKLDGFEDREMKQVVERSNEILGRDDVSVVKYLDSNRYEIMTDDAIYHVYINS